jgi:Predicted membrane protein
MKELFLAIIHFQIKKLFKERTDNTWFQIFRFAFVGGLAFLTDALVLFLLEKYLMMHYLVAATFGFIFGLIVNYILSKKFVFQDPSNVTGRVGEFIVFAVIAVIGLAITAFLMYLFTDIFGLHYMISKIIAAGIVMVWNFVSRKLILYRK